MTFDDAIYAFLLILSLCLGPLVNRSGRFKMYTSAFFGLILIFCSVGLAIWHSLVTVFGFIFLFGLCSPRFIHYLSCIWCFGYLGFFRTCHYFGFERTSSVVNAVQLLITLRLIGLSFELFDTWQTQQRLVKLSLPSDQSEHEKLTLWLQYKGVIASPLDVLCYSYCFIGIFIGPYYKYRTFIDFATSPIVSREASAEHMVQRLQEAPLFGVAYLILSHFYTVDYVRLEEFNERNFSYRFAYMIIIFFVFRLRVYFAWKMAECVCIASGLGAYPPESAPVVGEGPTDLKAFDKWMTKNISTPCPASKTAESNTRLVNSLHTINSNGGVGLASPIVVHETIDYTTITNISVWGCEFTTTVREGMRSWNQTVQYWLAFNFFKRCYGSRAMRYIWTMLVSAYWHGLYPGYYLSFLTIPLAMVAESELAVVICSCGRGLPSGSLSFFSWILKMRVFEYCCMGFLLLDAEGTLAYWHSIGYCVHVLLVAIIVLGVVLRRLCPEAAAAAAAAAASSVLRTVPTSTERLDTASESKVYP